MLNNMAESVGSAEAGETSGEGLAMKAVLIGATGAIGECLLGELLGCKVCEPILHLLVRPANPVSIKCKLQTGYKMQSETKTVSSSNTGHIFKLP